MTKKNLIKQVLLYGCFVITIGITTLNAQSKEVKSAEYSNAINRYWFLDGIRLDMTNFPENTPHALSINKATASAFGSKNNNAFIFATNGREIYSQDTTIKDGKNLSGGKNTNQTLIIPANDNDGSSIDIYYAFTLPWQDKAKDPILKNAKISVSPVALSHRGSWGGFLLQKNTPLEDEFGNPLEYATGAITSVPIANGDGYWVLIPNGNKLYSYRIDKRLSIQPAAVSEIGSLNPELKQNGYIKASLEYKGGHLGSTHLIIIGNSDGLDNGDSQEDKALMTIRGFDNKTGKLTNLKMPVFLFDAPAEDYVTHDAEFSSNGEVLYIASKKAIYAFSLNSVSGVRKIFDTVETYNCNDCLGGISRAADGNIYFLSRNNNASTNTIIGKITNQNSLKNSGVSNNLFKYTNNGGLGLPQYVVPLTKKAVAQNNSTAYSFNPKDETNVTLGSNKTSKINIYPNPVKNKVNIIANTKIAALKIVSAENRTIAAINGLASKNYMYNTSKLSRGVYILVITTHNGNVITKKIKKN